MSNTTCNYNQTHQYFNRQEIRMLAQALGLPEQRIEIKLNKHGIGERVETSILLNLIENGAFISDFNHMYNNQSGQYNSAVLAKALKLIDGHLFTFNDILKARLAFDIYEMNSLKNNKSNVDLILQTIRFCDHRISRLKLEQRLRHYRLSKLRTLHLCEYFDLLLNCTRDNSALGELLTKKTIDIADPKPVDQQIMDDLNKKYLHEERNWDFQEIVTKEKLMESSVWPAKLINRYQLEDASMRKIQLRKQLSTSITSLKQSRAGSACTTPSHRLNSNLQQSRPISNYSTLSVTPPLVDQRSLCSSVQSNRSVIIDNDLTNRIEQLRSESAFLAVKYSVYHEDYMNELFPDGYSKPIITPKPMERRIRRMKSAKSSIYWSGRSRFK